MNAKADDLVIARYSALPFYRELENDLKSVGAFLINSYRQHRWIADLGEWVEELRELTPRTWDRLECVPDSVFPIVVKGETNSRKFNWDTHMFAADRRTASHITGLLQDDGLICDQKIYYRQFIPLVNYMTGFRGMPVSKEFRFFVCDGKILSGGFYWENYADDINCSPDVREVPKKFLASAIEKIGDNARFVVIDVAQKVDGEWIVVELNDGQMSGLSANNPNVLYKNLALTLNK